MGFGQAEIRAQQIGHRTLAEPRAMQLPLAARRDQPVTGQNLKHLIPSGAFAIGWQSIRPEPVQFQLAPELAGQPAGTPLAWPAQPHLRQAKLND